MLSWWVWYGLLHLTLKTRLMEKPAVSLHAAKRKQALMTAFCQNWENTHSTAICFSTPLPPVKECSVPTHKDSKSKYCHLSHKQISSTLSSNTMTLITKNTSIQQHTKDEKRGRKLLHKNSFYFVNLCSKVLLT